METALFIGVFILAIVYFLLFNSVFDVYYFGCGGMSTVIIVCFAIAYFSLAVVIAYWYVTVPAGLLIWFLAKKGKGAK